VKKQRLAFKGNDGQSVCNYHVFEDQGQQYLVIEQLRDTKTSVTNRIEHLIADICKAEKLQESTTKIFEYYPASLLGNDWLYEMRGVSLRNGEPVWYTPTQGDIATVKTLVIPG
jgi:hypothetical protein